MSRGVRAAAATAAASSGRFFLLRFSAFRSFGAYTLTRTRAAAALLSAIIIVCACYEYEMKKIGGSRKELVRRFVMTPL